MNLAHIKYLSMLLGALCTMQTVLSKLTEAFGDKASRESCFRRIQRFMAQLVLDFDVVAEYLRSRIPLDGPYTLTMDRTNWKLGALNINALVLGIAHDHLMPRHILDVLSINHQQGEAAGLKNVDHELPIHSRAFHRHVDHTQLQQPSFQFCLRSCRRFELPRLTRNPCSLDCGHDYLLVCVQSATPVYDLTEFDCLVHCSRRTRQSNFSSWPKATEITLRSLWRVLAIIGISYKCY